MTRGFTLLELTLVVLIISLVALGAVAVVGDEDYQVRVEDTQSRLRRVRRAMLGAEELGAPSGYVADLGWLPGTFDSLVRKPAGVHAAGDEETRARFAPGSLAVDPASPPSGTVVLSDAAHLLPKGWRGPYLALDPSRDPSNARYRDGFGNVSPIDDGDDHGWAPLFPPDPSVTPLADYDVTSYGADGRAGDAGESRYDADVTLRITQDEWTVDLMGSPPVVVRNLGASAAADLRICLLVYEAGTWRRFNSDGRQTIAAGESAAFSFPSGTRVPAGTHLLAVIEDTNDTDGDGETLYGSSPYFTARVVVRARAGLEPGVEVRLP